MIALRFPPLWLMFWSCNLLDSWMKLCPWQCTVDLDFCEAWRIFTWPGQGSKWMLQTAWVSTSSGSSCRASVRKCASSCASVSDKKVLLSLKSKILLHLIYWVVTREKRASRDAWMVRVHPSSSAAQRTGSLDLDLRREIRPSPMSRRVLVVMQSQKLNTWHCEISFVTFTTAYIIFAFGNINIEGFWLAEPLGNIRWYCLAGGNIA